MPKRVIFAFDYDDTIVFTAGTMRRVTDHQNAIVLGNKPKDARLIPFTENGLLNEGASLLPAGQDPFSDDIEKLLSSLKYDEVVGVTHHDLLSVEKYLYPLDGTIADNQLFGYPNLVEHLSLFNKEEFLKRYSRYRFTKTYMQYEEPDAADKIRIYEAALLEAAKLKSGERLDQEHIKYEDITHEVGDPDRGVNGPIAQRLVRVRDQRPRLNELAQTEKHLQMQRVFNDLEEKYPNDEIELIFIDDKQAGADSSQIDVKPDYDPAGRVPTKGVDKKGQPCSLKYAVGVHNDLYDKIKTGALIVPAGVTLHTLQYSLGEQYRGAGEVERDQRFYRRLTATSRECDYISCKTNGSPTFQAAGTVPCPENLLPGFPVQPMSLEEFKENFKQVVAKKGQSSRGEECRPRAAAAAAAHDAYQPNAAASSVEPKQRSLVKPKNFCNLFAAQNYSEPRKKNEIKKLLKEIMGSTGVTTTESFQSFTNQCLFESFSQDAPAAKTICYQICNAINVSREVVDDVLNELKRDLKPRDERQPECDEPEQPAAAAAADDRGSLELGGSCSDEEYDDNLFGLSRSKLAGGQRENFLRRRRPVLSEQESDSDFIQHFTKARSDALQPRRSHHTTPSAQPTPRDWRGGQPERPAAAACRLLPRIRSWV